MSDFIFSAALVALVTFLVWLGVRESNNEWAKFKVEHNCKVTQRMPPTVGTGFGVGANGQAAVVIVVEPGRTGYLCDGGVTYWR